MSDFTITRAKREDWAEIGLLIQASTNAWYENQAKTGPFSCDAEDMTVYCEVYEDLDPNCCLIVRDVEQQKIAGSCFYHPRKSHFSLGIMNVHPDFYGKGIAARLLKEIVHLSEQAGLPLRLVSSSMNLDSFSLYNKQGFIPTANFQDMLVQVPEKGFEQNEEDLRRVRPATSEDLKEIYQLEKSLTCIDREEDLAYFIENRLGIWTTMVYENDSGDIDGYLNAIDHAATKMVGPGVMKNETVAIALHRVLLNQFKGKTMLCLVPCDCPKLIEAFYVMKAKNCELHFSQVRGRDFEMSGISIPTFLPETA